MSSKFRTEKILAWIGNILSILSVLMIGLFVVVMTKNPDFKESFMIQLIKEANVTSEEALNTYHLLVSYLQVMLVLSSIFLLGALIATLMLNKSKASGVILIIVALLKLILTFGTGIITSVLWLIAGIKRVMNKDITTKDDEMVTLENINDAYEYR